MVLLDVSADSAVIDRRAELEKLIPFFESELKRVGVTKQLLHRDYTDWTSIIVQSLLRQIERNTYIYRPIPLYDFSNIGMLEKSHWYYIQ